MNKNYFGGNLIGEIGNTFSSLGRFDDTTIEKFKKMYEGQYPNLVIWASGGKIHVCYPIDGINIDAFASKKGVITLKMSGEKKIVVLDESEYGKVASTGRWRWFYGANNENGSQVRAKVFLTNERELDHVEVDVSCAKKNGFLEDLLNHLYEGVVAEA